MTDLPFYLEIELQHTKRRVQAQAVAKGLALVYAYELFALDAMAHEALEQRSLTLAKNTLSYAITLRHQIGNTPRKPLHP